MTRVEEIEVLRLRYKRAMTARKWKTATMIYVRLRYLVKMQLRHENRHRAGEAA